MSQQKQLQWLSLGVTVIFGAVLMAALNGGRGMFIFETKKPEVLKPHLTPEETEREDAFQMVIRGKLAEIQKCYNAQLKQGLNKSGNLVIRWAVDTNGKASDFREEVNELSSTELFDCATTAIGSWRFPQNRPIYIRYTFKMKALEREKIIREVSSLDE